jgi:YD repeat-containing protein
MSNDIKVSDGGNLLSVLRPTALGKAPKPTMKDLDIRPAARKLFAVENGEVKVPRKRAAKMEWPEWFNDLDAPRTLYIWTDGTVQHEVEWNEEAKLFERTDEDGKLHQYTGDSVFEMADPDAREVSGPPEVIAQLAAAVARFNKHSGKTLASRLEKATRDKTGRTVSQTNVVYRLK